MKSQSQRPEPCGVRKPGSSYEIRSTSSCSFDRESQWTPSALIYHTRGLAILLKPQRPAMVAWRLGAVLVPRFCTTHRPRSHRWRRHRRDSWDASASVDPPRPYRRMGGRNPRRDRLRRWRHRHDGVSLAPEYRDRTGRRHHRHHDDEALSASLPDRVHTRGFLAACMGSLLPQKKSAQKALTAVNRAEPSRATYAPTDCYRSPAPLLAA